MRNLLLSSVSLLLVPAVTMAAPDFISHTHTTPIELETISSSSGVKTAAICFLGIGDCDPNVGFGKSNENYNVDTVAQCKNEGYVLNNCSSVQTPKTYCPYNKSYISGCKCATNLITCPAGQVGVGESCGGKYASCQCDPSLVSCASNQVGQGASCGGKYQSCVCKSEYMYTSSNCTSPRSLSGASCGGKYNGCSCPTGVSAGTYGCETYYSSPCSSVCQKAYTDNCHNRADNNSAVYGCMKTWSDCPSKCETPYTDNCRNRVDVPHSNGCVKYYADCSSKCETAAETCQIGSIYYNGGFCSSPKNYNSSLKPLGVVIYVTDNGAHGQVMAPGDLGRMSWASSCVDIPIMENYTSESSAVKDFDSCGNTNKITAYGSSLKYPAAWAAKNYAPTPETAGKWCLPAAGVFANANAFSSKISEGLHLMNGTYIYDSARKNEYFWTSTEMSAKGTFRSQNTNTEEWDSSMPNNIVSASKSSSCGASKLGYVKPVLEF